MMHRQIRRNGAAKIAGKSVGFVISQFSFNIIQPILTDKAITIDLPLMHGFAWHGRAETRHMFVPVGS